MNLMLAAVLATLGGSPEPQWIPDYGEALQVARAARRPLLVVLDHAPPSDKMRPASHRAVAPLLESYVLCRVEVSTPYGKKVADAFRATVFPYAAVIDNTGSRILARRQGELTEASWTTLLTRRQSSRPPVVSSPVFSMPQPCFT
jgi:hypothetical protein